MANAKRAEVSKWSEIGGRITGFFRNIIAELKKVHWPNRKELVTYTIVVFISVAFIAILIWLADSVIGLLMKQLFKSVGK